MFDSLILFQPTTVKILLALTVAKTSVEQPETDSSTVMEDDIEDWNSNEEGAGTKGEIFYLSAITMHRLYLVGTCW